MGSFNFTGFISDLNIKEWDECVLIPLYKPKKDKSVKTYSKIRDYDEDWIFNFSIIKDWVPFCLPIYGKYNEYWTLEDIEYNKKELKYLEFALKIEDIQLFLDSIQEWESSVEELNKLFELFDFSYVIEHKSVYEYLKKYNQSLYSSEKWFKPDDLLKINFEIVESSDVDSKTYKGKLNKTPEFDKIPLENLKYLFPSEILIGYDIYKLKDSEKDRFIFVWKVKDQYESCWYKTRCYIYDWKELNNYRSNYYLADLKQNWEDLGGDKIDISYFNYSIYDEDYDSIKNHFSLLKNKEYLELTNLKSFNELADKIKEYTLLKESEEYKTVEWENFVNKKFTDEQGCFIKYNHPLLENDKCLRERMFEFTRIFDVYNWGFNRSQSIIAFETNSLYLKAILNWKLKKEISGFNQFLTNMRLANKMFRIPLACTQFGEDDLENNLLKVYKNVIKKHLKEKV